MTCRLSLGLGLTTGADRQPAHAFHPGKEEQAAAAREELASELVLPAQIDSDSRSGTHTGRSRR